MIPSVGYANSNTAHAMIASANAYNLAMDAQWFERADGRGRFILDRSSHPALLWPEGSYEVIPIYRARAAGGGEVWLTDTDRTILRQSHLGGWTYFPSDQPDGVIVEIIGDAEPLSATPVDDSEIQSAARDLANALTRLSRTVVTVELYDLGSADTAYIIDTMKVIEQGGKAAQRRASREIRTVTIGVGTAPAAHMIDGVLEVWVVPEMGYGGRLSSDYIRRVLDQNIR